MTGKTKVLPWQKTGAFAAAGKHYNVFAALNGNSACLAARTGMSLSIACSSIACGLQPDQGGSQQKRRRPRWTGADGAWIIDERHGCDGIAMVFSKAHNRACVPHRHPRTGGGCT